MDNLSYALSAVALKGQDPDASQAARAAGMVARRVVDQKSLDRDLVHGKYSMDGTLADPDKGRAITDKQRHQRWEETSRSQFNLDMLKQWDSPKSEIAEAEARLKSIKERSGENKSKYMSTAHSIRPSGVKRGYFIGVGLVAVLIWVYSFLLGGWSSMPAMWALAPAAASLIVGMGGLFIRTGKLREGGLWGCIPVGFLVGLLFSNGPIPVSAGLAIVVALIAIADARGDISLPRDDSLKGVIFGSAWKGMEHPDFVAGHPPVKSTNLPDSTRLDVRLDEIPELFAHLLFLLQDRDRVQFHADRLVAGNLALDVWCTVTNSTAPEFGARFGSWSAYTLGRAYAYSIGEEIGASTLLGSSADIDMSHSPDWVKQYCGTIRHCVPSEAWEDTKGALLSIITPREGEFLPGAVQIRLNNIIGCLLTM